MPTVCTISHASVAETQATATPESLATEPIALLGDTSLNITEVANTIPPRISHPLPDSNPVVAQENLCAVGTVSTISEDSDSVPRGPSAHSDSSSDIPRVSPISDRVPKRTPQIATIVPTSLPAVVVIFATLPPSKRHTTQRQMRCEKAEKPTPSDDASVALPPTQATQSCSIAATSYRPSFDTAAPKRGVSATMCEMFNQCIRSPSDTTLVMRGLWRFVRAFGMVLGVVKSSFRPREHVHDKGGVAVNIGKNPPCKSCKLALNALRIANMQGTCGIFPMKRALPLIGCSPLQEQLQPFCQRAVFGSPQRGSKYIFRPMGVFPTPAAMCKNRTFRLQHPVVSLQSNRLVHQISSKPPMRGPSHLPSVPIATPWSTQSETESRRHVCDGGTPHFRQYDRILHLLRHVFASDHATAARTIALRWPTSNCNRSLQQHIQAPQQHARAPRFTFFDTQLEEATSEVQPLWQWSHALADPCVAHTRLLILRKASFEFSGSADACTIAPTHTLVDPVPSHMGQRLCVNIGEPLSRGSIYLAGGRQATLGIRSYSDRPRRNVREHLIATSPTTLPIPKCGSFRVQPRARTLLHLAYILRRATSAMPRVFKSRRRVRSKGELHIQQSDPIPRRQRHVFNSKHATIVRRFALRWLRSGEVRCRRRRLQSPRQRAQALSLAFFNSQTEMAITRVQLLWRPSHVCAELRASQARLQILFNASLAFSDTAVTCAIARTRKLCDLVLSHSGWNVCAIASKPPSRGNFSSGGRLQATLRIGGTAYRFRGHVLDIGGLHIYQLDLSPIGHRATALAVVQHSRRLLYFFRQQQIAIDVGTRAYGLRSDVQGQSIVISPVTQPAPEYGLISAAPRVRTPPRLSGVLKRSSYITLRVIKSRRHVRDGADLKIRRTDPLPRSRHVFATRTMSLLRGPSHFACRH
ncbi:hypothetical protein V8E53_001701 [Lactarius tabidus]